MRFPICHSLLLFVTAFIAGAIPFSVSHGVQPDQIVEEGKSSLAPTVVDRSTLTGKVMVGYQGWFNCEGDGANLGWTHWAKNRRELFAPGNVTVDLWPEMTELDPDERFKTGFKHQDGQFANVYSNANRKTGVRHFKWMQEYGIDGAFVQRFANGLKNKEMLQHKNNVLAFAREGANQHGRTFAVMYDLSGLASGEVARVKDDWSLLQNELKIGSDAAYLHHDGHPVVAVWGIGFVDDRKYSLHECNDLVKWLKAQGCTVMLGVPSFWRDGRRDATDDPMLKGIIQAADIVSPWSVGRYRTPKDATRHAEEVWHADREWCDAQGLDFLPVAFPGFSRHNLQGDEIDAIPRLKGEFLRSQVLGAMQAKCDMLYIAMFDEVDEGTAIYKCTNDPPLANGGKFMTYDGLPSDHYLRLTGDAGRLLRQELAKQE